MATIKPANILEKIKSTPKELKNLIVGKSPDRKILLYFSLGYLVERYMMQAEEMMKRGRGMETTYFTGKATRIKEMTRKIFGSFPEKDFYTDTYEVPESWEPQTDPEEIEELAKFCVSNLPQVPSIRDVDKLKEVIDEKLSDYKRKGIITSFTREVNRAKNKWNDPNKLSILLEIIFLLENVNEVLKAIKEETEEDTEEEAEEEVYPGIRKGEESVDKGEGELAGFKVEK